MDMWLRDSPAASSPINSMSENLHGHVLMSFTSSGLEAAQDRVELAPLTSWSATAGPPLPLEGQEPPEQMDCPLVW